MSAWTTKDPPGGAAGHGASGEAIANDGIVKGHAYSLISIDEYNADGQIFRMVRLRNPWGANPAAEWKGAFSDNWPNWPSYPQLRECLKIGSAECDGMFWMSWDDFRNRYSDCGVAPTKMNVPRSGKSESLGSGATAQAPHAKHGKKFRKTGGVPAAPMIIAAQQPLMIAAPQPITYASAPVSYASPVTYASAPLTTTYAAAPTTTFAAAPTTVLPTTYAAAPMMSSIVIR